MAGTPFSSVNIVFEQVSGPGNVYLFSTSGFGEVQSLLNNGSTRLTSGTAIPQKRPAHTHANWVFSKPGTYKMRVHVQGKDSRGNVSKSNVATYTWSVGDGSAPKPSTKPSAAGKGTSKSASGANSASHEPGESGVSTSGMPGANGSSSESGTSEDSSSDELPTMAADGGSGGSASGSGELANTGVEPTTAALIALGVGLTVFGAGWVLLNRSALRVANGGASGQARGPRDSQK